MKKTKIKIEEIRIIYRVTKRKISLAIGGFIIAALSVASSVEPIQASVAPISSFDTDITYNLEQQTHISQQIFNQIENKDDADFPLMKQWEEEIDDIVALPDDWDEEGSSAILPGTADNCKSVLKDTAVFVKYLDTIYPTPFGTICIEWKLPDGFLNVELSGKSMAFYHDFGFDKAPVTFEKAPFSKDGVKLLLNEMKPFA